MTEMSDGFPKCVESSFQKTPSNDLDVLARINYESLIGKLVLDVSFASLLELFSGSSHRIQRDADDREKAMIPRQECKIQY
jgi:hypothetical protein